ncbi:profilin-2-like [Paramormyrops kingsleyae]|uniref:profilin-2-like n=1 Tax=Paramormyrops kingsleyae TaxID=1676925 RepID=UPI000CD667B8|nr:profilin-2-like [Paramormyrops kingsleyae]
MSAVSLQDYVDSVLPEEQYADWAIVNHRKRKVLAAKRWGWLGHLTRQEVKTLLTGDREAIQTQGLTLGGMQCSLIRDNMGTPGDRSMDLRTKPRPGRGVAVRRSRRVLVLLVGQRGVHGAVLHQMAYKIASNIDDGDSQIIQ